jgi:hypothetical protein
MNGVSEDELVHDTETDRRPSWPYPTILFLYVLVFLITPTIGTTIGLVLFFGLMGVCLWGAVSRSQYEKMQKRYPSLLRSAYVMNMIVFPVVVPLVILVLLLVLQ